MKQFAKLFLMAAATTSVLFAAGAQAATPLSAASTAGAANISLSLNGDKLSLGNLVNARGSAMPLYNNRNTLPSYSKTFAGPAGSSIVVALGGVVSAANATKPVPTRLLSRADASVGTVNLSISTLLGSLISIKAKGVAAHSAFLHTVAGPVDPRGSASIGNVTISAPLLGVPQKSFSGIPTPNQVLFQTPDKSVTVYLNRQKQTTVAGKPTSITTDAIAVEIGGKSVLGSLLSADVVVGTTLAN